MAHFPLIVNFPEDEMEQDLWTKQHSWSYPMLPFMAPLHEKRTRGGYKRNWSQPGKTQAASCHQKNPMRPISTMGKDGFQVSMDVQHFAPNEVTVKTVGHSVVIEAKHEEKTDDHGSVSRHFTRRYTLPQEYDMQQVVSSLSSDGVLTVKAASPTHKELGERIVEIQHTGPAHLTVKHNEEHHEEEKKKDEEAKME